MTRASLANAAANAAYILAWSVISTALGVMITIIVLSFF